MITGLSLLPSLKADAQDIWGTPFPLPKGKINLFMYKDSAQNDFNDLKTPSARNNYAESIRASDITPTIPTGVHVVNGKEYGWACVQASGLFEYNSNDWKDLYDSDRKKYGWYAGEVLDSIYLYGGTTKFRGSHKAPVFGVQVSPTHQINYIITGNDLRNGKSLNLIETMYKISKSNVQFDGMLYPMNFDDFMLYYAYSYIDGNGRNSYGNIPVVKYKLEDGILKFEATNPNVDVILTRDTIAPVIDVKFPADGATYTSSTIPSVVSTIDENYYYG